jgi:hypothetical protein
MSLTKIKTDEVGLNHYERVVEVINEMDELGVVKDNEEYVFTLTRMRLEIEKRITNAVTGGRRPTRGF